MRRGLDFNIHRYSLLNNMKHFHKYYGMVICNHIGKVRVKIDEDLLSSASLLQTVDWELIIKTFPPPISEIPFVPVDI